MFIRTKDNRILKVLDEADKTFYIDVSYDIGFRLWVKGKNDIIKQADTIEDLIQEGDLVKYEDRTRSYPYPAYFAEIADGFNPHGISIYRVAELYIKQPNGDYKLVARDKGRCKLELI